MKKISMILLVLAMGVAAMANDTSKVAFEAKHIRMGLRVLLDSVKVSYEGAAGSWTAACYAPDTEIFINVIRHGIDMPGNAAGDGIGVKCGTNPFCGSTWVSVTAWNGGQASVELIGLDGRVVARYNGYLPAGESRFVVGSDKPHVYLLRVRHKDGARTVKLACTRGGGEAYVRLEGTMPLDDMMLRTDTKSGDSIVIVGDIWDFEELDVRGYTTDVFDSVREVHLTRVINGHAIITLMFDYPIFHEGTLPGVFSVAEGRHVKFSQGNLQFNAAMWTWRFAGDQTTIIGTGNRNIGYSYDGWIDLFGWGTSGWDNGNYLFSPYNYESGSRFAGDEGYGYGPKDGQRNSEYDLTGIYANSDWGVYNPIYNGGDSVGMWRTLSKDEAEYLLLRRRASDVGGIKDARFAKAMVNGLYGMIIFPDEYDHPEGLAFPRYVNDARAIYDSNQYALQDWNRMELAGACFLPAGGYRNSNGVREIDVEGRYWTTTHYRYDCAYYYGFGRNFVGVDFMLRYLGLSVRLVRDVD